MMENGNPLLPDSSEADDDGEEDILHSRARQIKDVILSVGITQLVLGILLIIYGILIAVTWPSWGLERCGEGIWCGLFVMICGVLGITARFHLRVAVVITSLVANVLTAVVLASGGTIAIFTVFSDIYHHRVGKFFQYFGLSLCLLTCLVVSIYLSVIFGKVLRSEKKRCCFRRTPKPGYTFVYMPHGPGMQNNYGAAGAFATVPPEAEKDCTSLAPAV